MSDALLIAIRDCLVEELQVDRGKPTTLLAERLTRTVRETTFHDAPLQEILSPQERLSGLSLVRRELRRLDKDYAKNLGRGRWNPDLEEAMRRRRMSVRSLYRKLGGNPDSLEDRAQDIKWGGS